MERYPSEDDGQSALWIIDYGTRTIPVGAQIRQAHQQPAPGNTAVVRLQGQSKQDTPQVVGYVRRHGSLDFVWGYELSRLRHLSNRQPRAYTVVAAFECLKIAILGSGHEAVAARKSIEDQLLLLDVPEKTADDLFVRHLIALQPAVSAAVTKEFASSGRSAQQISKMPVRVFFAVPEIAGLDKLHNLSNLLKRASFPETTLIPEAEAAGAWQAFRYCSGNLGPRASPQVFAAGAGHVVCDAGGWTCNISSYTMTGSPSDGARMGMKSTGRMESLALGSEMVNKKLHEYIKQRIVQDIRAKDLPSALAKMGITENSLEYSLSRSFESFKVFFQEEETRTMEVKAADHLLDLYYEVEADQVTTWIDELAGQMITAIDRVRPSNAKLLTMTGGFSFNAHLIEVLTSHFEPSGLIVIAAGSDPYGSADFAVVKGAPARFHVEAPKLPFPYALCMPQDELYSEKLHPDMETDLLGPIPDPDEPENEARDWVEDRYAEILPRGKLMTNSSVSHVRWQKLDIREAAFEYAKEIFCTKADIPEHDPIRPNGHLRPELILFDTLKASFTLQEVMEMPLLVVLEPEPEINSEPTTKPKAGKARVKPRVPPRRSGRTSHTPASPRTHEDQALSPEHELYLKLTTTLHGMDVSVKMERPKNGSKLYSEVYEDNDEPVSSDEPASNRRNRVWQFRDPPQEDMIFVTSTSLLDTQYLPQLQREEGPRGTTSTTETQVTHKAIDRADSLLEMIEEEEEDTPTNKRRRGRRSK